MGITENRYITSYDDVNTSRGTKFWSNYAYQTFEILKDGVYLVEGLYYPLKLDDTNSSDVSLVNEWLKRVRKIDYDLTNHMTIMYNPMFQDTNSGNHKSGYYLAPIKKIEIFKVENGVVTVADKSNSQKFSKTKADYQEKVKYYTKYNYNEHENANTTQFKVLTDVNSYLMDFNNLNVYERTKRTLNDRVNGIQGHYYKPLQDNRKGVSVEAISSDYTYKEIKSYSRYNSVLETTITANELKALLECDKNSSTDYDLYLKSLNNSKVKNFIILAIDKNRLDNDTTEVLQQYKMNMLSIFNSLASHTTVQEKLNSGEFALLKGIINAKIINVVNQQELQKYNIEYVDTVIKQYKYNLKIPVFNEIDFYKGFANYDDHLFDVCVYVGLHKIG